jgi:hypothetical protein
MTWNAAYEPEIKTVLAQFCGLIPAETLREEVLATIELARQNDATRFLVDCSELEGSHSIIDLYGLIQLLDSSGWERVIREAIVLPQLSAPANDVLFWETSCRNRGYDVRVFKTMDEARAWIEK